MKKDYVRVMIGSGDNAQFITVKKGAKVMLFDGIVIRAGVTSKEFKQEMEDKMNRMCKKQDCRERLEKAKTKVLSLFK